MVEKETDNFLKNAKKYLDEKHSDQENFNPAFCSQLLKTLCEAIAKAQAKYQEFNFTAEYKVDIALTVCGHAIFVFEEMAEKFQLMNDPVEYLTREMKGPYCEHFISEYQQTAHEKTAARILCGRLVRPIEEKLMESLATTVAHNVKASSASFATKRSLKAKILTDLANKDSFSDYTLYLRDARSSAEAWVKKYCVEYCQESVQVGTTTSTRVTYLAKKSWEDLFS